MVTRGIRGLGRQLGRQSRSVGSQVLVTRESTRTRLELGNLLRRATQVWLSPQYAAKPEQRYLSVFSGYVIDRTPVPDRVTKLGELSKPHRELFLRGETRSEAFPLRTAG